MRRRWVVAIVAMAIMGAVLVSWGIVRAVEERRFRVLLADARRAIDAGQFASAHRHLDEVLASRPDCDEAIYHLGVCEQARHRVDVARKLFARVSPGSAWAGWSAVRASRIALDQGRFDECERLLLDALTQPGPHAAEARWGLVLLLRMEGRFDEARRCLQAGFDQMTSPLTTLRRLYKIDIDPFPIEGVGQALERAGRQAPDDDRVWLARAHLSIRTGDLDDARDWLDRCLRRRPEDPAVWRMRLEWGLAADRPDVVQAALPHLPAAVESEGRVLTIRAWLAAHRGDRDAEIQALSEKIAIDPGDGPSRERLASLDREAGRTQKAEALRASLPDIERARQEYIRWLASSDPTARADTMADLADRLGRSFDASQWRRLGGQDVPVPAVPDPADRREVRNGPTLADAVGEPAIGSSPQPTMAASHEPRKVLRFVDDAHAVGLDFVQRSGGSKGRLIPPVTASGGVGLIDIDGDGWLDVYLTQGGPFPPDPNDRRNHDRLFRNRGDGTFEDVSASSGIAAMPGGYGHGVAVADVDNDGHPDLFITRWRSYALYRNRGDGTFEDATDRAGLSGDRDWPTSAAFADLDNDGDLDLYVCHYLTWDEHDIRACSDPDDPSVYRCLPLDFPSLPDHLFRNDGGRFVDINAEAGIVDHDGRGLGVVAADLDEDGKIDLYVANDMTANFFFRNLGSLRFEEVGLSTGLAGNATGAYQAGMGIACGDVDGDQHPDLAVTNFYNESTSFFHNLGGGIFVDQTAAIGLAGPSRYVLGFGVAFLDVDNDGWLDLMTANGHVNDGRPQFPWKMPVQLYHNDGGRRLVDVSRQAGSPFDVLRMGRGMAAGDLDNDGRIDALIVSQDEPIANFHNQTDAGHWITLRLEGTTSNRDAVGAVVRIHAGGRTQTGRRLGGGSYQSAGDPRLHFGLGPSTVADRVEVHWPSGHIDRFTNLDADTGYALREGDAAPCRIHAPSRPTSRGRLDPSDGA